MVLNSLIISRKTKLIAVVSILFVLQAVYGQSIARDVNELNHGSSDLKLEDFSSKLLRIRHVTT
jgi:hypothetical protein